MSQAAEFSCWQENSGIWRMSIMSNVEHSLELRMGLDARAALQRSRQVSMKGKIL